MISSISPSRFSAARAALSHMIQSDIDQLFSKDVYTRSEDEHPYGTRELTQVPDIQSENAVMWPVFQEEFPKDTADRILLYTYDPNLPFRTDENSFATIVFRRSDLQSESVSFKESYERRIADLRGMAVDEGVTVAESPIEEFWKLVYCLCPTNKAQLVLSQKGELTAIWKDDDGNYAHVRFAGTDKLRYVIVTAPQNESGGESVVGDCKIPEVKPLIEKYKLENLLGLYEQ